MKTRGYILIISAALLWGIIGPVARRAFAEGVSPMEVAFWRAVLAWCFFGVHALLQRRILFKSQDLHLMLIFAVTGVTLFYASYQFAVQKGGAALAAVLLYTAPAWVAIMSRVFFKERMNPAKITALAATLIGVAAISLGGDNIMLTTTPMAVVWGLLAGFSYSLYYIFGKYFQGRYSAPNLFFYILPLGAAGLFPWVTFTDKTLTAWLCLFSLSFLSTYGAYFCYYAGLKYLEPTQAAISATMEPVIAAAVAYLWWGEYFSLQGYLGSILILGSVVLMIMDGTRKSCRQKL
jgi:drug/metabolite transporter (DMT)-like permease